MRDRGAAGGPSGRTGTRGMPSVRLTVSQQPYLADDRDEMHAVLEVETHGLAGRASGGDAAEVIVIDCSGSMGWPPTKLSAARRATAAAVGVLRDGTSFAVIGGRKQAEMVYPTTKRLAIAGADSRAEAARAAARLYANDGTAIGSWLALARTLLAGHPARIRHVLLLTDGRDEDESPDRLERVLAECAGEFTCDARGIGRNWDAAELTAITGRLHGSADAVLRDADLEAEFRSMMEHAMAKALPDLRLRVSHRVGSGIRYLKQVYPFELDLTAEGVRTGARTWEYPTRAWGDEAREFHLCLTADPTEDVTGEEYRLAVVDVTTPGGSVSASALPEPRPVVVRWTNDPALSTRTHPRIAHYVDHQDLGRAVVDGCDAYDDGDLAVAAERWGLAVRLAHRLGDRKMLDRLGALVEIDDPATGGVRIRSDVRAEGLNAALVMSGHSTRWQAPAARPDRPEASADAARATDPAGAAPDAGGPARATGTPAAAAPGPTGHAQTADTGGHVQAAEHAEAVAPGAAGVGDDAPGVAGEAKAPGAASATGHAQTADHAEAPDASAPGAGVPRAAGVDAGACGAGGAEGARAVGAAEGAGDARDPGTPGPGDPADGGPPGPRGAGAAGRAQGGGPPRPHRAAGDAPARAADLVCPQCGRPTSRAGAR